MRKQIGVYIWNVMYTVKEPYYTFRYSSGATLMKRFLLKSLWWVTKGMAEAPPAILFIMGVSTSRKSRDSKYFRAKEIILDLKECQKVLIERLKYSCCVAYIIFPHITNINVKNNNLGWAALYCYTKFEFSCSSGWHNSVARAYA